MERQQMGTRHFKRGSDEAVSRSFKACEFDCSCAHQDCCTTMIDDALVIRLQRMRDILGCPIQITSAYRCGDKQSELRIAGYETSGGTSTHQRGRAVDLATGRHSGVELERAAREAGFKSIGVSERWIHVDTRNGRERRWEYKKR